MAGGDHYFWLGASADADPALVASDEARSDLHPSGVDPLRGHEHKWRGDFSDRIARLRCDGCLTHYTIRLPE